VQRARHRGGFVASLTPKSNEIMKLIASRAVPPNVKLDVELARRQADTRWRSVS